MNRLLLAFGFILAVTAAAAGSARKQSTQSVLVSGAVRNPGAYPWQEGATLFQIWKAAGGPNRVWSGEIILKRIGPDGEWRTSLNLKFDRRRYPYEQWLEAWRDEQSQIALKPRDRLDFVVLE